MSMYEGLTLLLSMFSTFATVYIGFRQLRQAAPAPAAAATHPMAYQVPPTYAASPPAPAMGRAPVTPAPAPYPAYGGPHYPVPAATPAQPGRRVRPGPVRAASILLFLAAALQPVTLLAYYGIEYAINAEAARTDLGGSGVTDLTIFGIIAVLCGILGILIARGSKGAVWTVWVLGALGVPFAGIAILGLLLNMVSPAADSGPVGLLLIVVAYLVVVSLALTVSACLLLNPKARAFFAGR
jgi:hypothetical protein